MPKTVNLTELSHFAKGGFELGKAFVLLAMVRIRKDVKCTQDTAGD